MNRKKATLVISMALICHAFLFISSCAKSPYINVDYRLGNEKKNVATQGPVYIEVVDLRSDTETLNNSAKKKFADFSEQFSLKIQEPNSQLMFLGTYTLPHLFKTAFTRRLNKLGISVVEQPSSEALTLQIEINRFKISLIEGDWLADIGYRASIRKHEKNIASETVTGSAQRLKGIGSGGAERVTGEIFTDVVNGLKIERLLAKGSRKNKFTD
jgi:hypothetical protein